MKRSMLLFGMLCATGGPALAQSAIDFSSSCPTYVALDAPFSPVTRLATLIDGVTADEPLRIAPTAIEVTEGFTVVQQMVSAGFRPDAANVRFAAYLNPQIADINELQPGTLVYLPAIEVYRHDRWDSYKPAAPIDGFAIDQKYSQVLKQALADDISEKVDDLERYLARAKSSDRYSAEDASLLGTIAGNLTAAASDLEPSQPNRLSERFAPTDIFVSYVDKNVELASRLEAVGFGQNIASASTRDTTAEITAALGKAGAPGLIDVTMLATSSDGQEIPGLVFKYMSKVAHDHLKCDPRHGMRFATESYRATQSIRRAEWYIWAENPTTGARSKPDLRDFTSIRDDSHIAKFYVEWLP